MPTLQHRLVRTFVDLADTLVADFDVTEVLYTLVERLTTLFDVSAVGLMLADEEGKLAVVASSGVDARIIELLEMQRQRGPCYDAFMTGKYISSGDLESERDRWPDVVEQALAAGFKAVHAVPMRLRSEVIGAINLFESTPTLGSDEIPVIRGLAEIATIAILQSRAMSEALATADQLRVALRTRIVLEQAKGVISQAEGISLEDAFSVLRKRARDQGMRLADVARDLVESQGNSSESPEMVTGSS